MQGLCADTFRTQSANTRCPKRQAARCSRQDDRRARIEPLHRSCRARLWVHAIRPWKEKVAMPLCRRAGRFGSSIGLAKMCGLGRGSNPGHRTRTREEREKKVESADKPGSVVDNHSSGPRVTARLKRPTRGRRGPRHGPPIRSCSRWGLPCRSVAGLAVRSCRTVSPLPRIHSPLPMSEPFGGLLSVALSVGSRRPGVTWHLALWSPDFPRCPCGRRGCLADSVGESSIDRRRGFLNAATTSAAAAAWPRPAR